MSAGDAAAGAGETSQAAGDTLASVAVTISAGQSSVCFVLFLPLQHGCNQLGVCHHLGQRQATPSAAVQQLSGCIACNAVTLARSRGRGAQSDADFESSALARKLPQQRR